MVEKDWDKIRNFRKEDFLCPCCKEENMEKEFVMFLDKMHDEINWPRTNEIATGGGSGYRCPKHNLEVGGKPDSAHPAGEAIDAPIKNNFERAKIIIYIILNRFIIRIGIFKHSLHVDQKKSYHPRIWVC